MTHSGGSWSNVSASDTGESWSDVTHSGDNWSEVTHSGDSWTNVDPDTSVESWAETVN